MDELVADLKRKFEPSQQHIKSVRNFPRRKKELFQNVRLFTDVFCDKLYFLYIRAVGW